MTARITRLDIEGLRVIDKLSLDLRPMNVLIGENGSGKSTVLEAVEILRKAATMPGEQFVQDLYASHGGATLFRNSTHSPFRQLTLAATIIDDSGSSTTYRIALTGDARTGAIKVPSEQLLTSGSLLAERQGEITTLWSGLEATTRETEFGATLLTANVFPGEAGEARRLVREVLRESLVYPPFETNPSWARRPSAPESGMRSSVLIQPARSLERGGANLPNAYQELKNRGAGLWTRILETLRLGVGADLDDVRVDASPSGGQIGLSVVFRSVGVVPAYSLSDGQLSFLALVAISELEADRDGILAFDEPDLHQHPAMIGRTVSLCERLSARRTVIVSTHSDRLLDALSDPADAVVLFERGPSGETIARRPDRAWLEKWLADYSGLGSARAEGYESAIFTDEVGPPSGAA